MKETSLFLPNHWW